MMRKLALAGFSTAILLWTGGESFGHGGQYRGPSDTVPPNLGGGGDTTPPGNPGGPGTPGPGAPTTTGGRAGPATGGGPNVPGGGAGGFRATTGGARRRGGATEGFERWEFWWEHNKEPFLNLKARLGDNAVVSESPGFYTGRGTKQAPVSNNRPSPTDVKTEIVPALQKLLDETNPDVVDSAALAIPRMVSGGEEDSKDVIEILKATLGHKAQTARESATLGLGVLGSRAGIETLKQIMNDTPEGRKLTKQSGEVEDLVRAFSAAALGLIGDASVFEDLKAVINDQRLNSKRDLKAMAILALGLMPERHEEIVPFLQGLMTDRSMDRVVRAQAPVALGRLQGRLKGTEQSPAARAALEPCLELFLDDKTDDDLNRSLAICLGQLATIEDARVIDALLDAVDKRTDDQTRYYSMMSLAQIGGRDGEKGDPAAHAEAHTKLYTFFLGELTKPKRVQHQPYGALGLAVYARMVKDKTTEAGDKILETFKHTNNPSYKGAMAVALGLLNHKAAQEDLWTEFEDSKDPPMKGYIAVSLGLMRAAGKAEQIRSLIQTKGLEASFRLQLARSLGLMGDTQAVKTLVDYLETAETLAESSSSAQALGLIGDRSAVKPLLDIVNNTTKGDLQRAFAAVALGIIAEKYELPWNSVFSVNSNYRAKVPALSEILDIL